MHQVTGCVIDHVAVHVTGHVTRCGQAHFVVEEQVFVQESAHFFNKYKSRQKQLWKRSQEVGGIHKIKHFATKLQRIYYQQLLQ